MYHLHSPLDTVKGIGEVLSAMVKDHGMKTVCDFLLNLPLRYEDFSHITTIDSLKDLEPNTPVTLKVQVVSSSQFYKNRKNILSARIKDATGKMACTWFNNRFLAPVLKKAEEDHSDLFFSGKTNKQGGITQPSVERALTATGEEKDTIHTGRLVPVYTSTLDLKQGKIRVLLKEVLDHLSVDDSLLTSLDSEETPVLPLKNAFRQSHFPDNEESIIASRERFALEEIIDLIQQSKAIKKRWQENHSAHAITIEKGTEMPQSIPFDLTAAQKRSVKEILSDIQLDTSMNRLLIGDVGSGKTVVAGIACFHVLKNGHHVSLVAPTQILAEQHTTSLQKIFPDFSIQLVTAKTKNLKAFTAAPRPTLYIGTHALINRLENIKPGLIIFDEQHRFGVSQRSQSLKLSKSPHILTMTATPIPRSLMLTIFSHLALSVIDELPAGRQPIKTWLVPEKKREEGFEWISKELLNHQQKTGNEGLAIVVCPFIDPSHHQAFENIASATETYKNVKKMMDRFSEKKLSTALLHGRLSQAKKDTVIQQLFERKINVLVTTPIVEVGLDLPNANIIVIEAAQRFGLASLHQLRGRVGRAGQKSYCLLFSSSKNTSSPKRLKIFCQESDGMKLAEFDLTNRGAGSIFGTAQSGYSDLHFASWTNLELLSQAQKIAQYLEKNDISWSPIWGDSGLKSSSILEKKAPMAN